MKNYISMCDMDEKTMKLLVEIREKIEEKYNTHMFSGTFGIGDVYDVFNQYIMDEDVYNIKKVKE